MDAGRGEGMAHLPSAAPREALTVATVAQSLALQSPTSWEVLRGSGFEVTFAASPDSWTPTVKQWGRFVPLHSSREVLSINNVRLLAEVRSLLRSQKWDLIQVQSPIASALVRILPDLPRHTPLIYVAHGFHFHRDARGIQNWLVSSVERTLARRTTAVAVVAEEDFQDAQAYGLDKHALLWQLPGAGVDIRHYSEALPESYPWRPAPTALFCGDLIPRKDPLAAVEAIVALNQSGRRCGLIVIGDGPLKAEVARSAAPLIRDGLFSHIPRSEHVANHLAGADVTLMPSWQEGLPRIAIESIAAGTPVVARTNRGARQLARSGGIALLGQSDRSPVGKGRSRCSRR